MQVISLPERRKLDERELDRRRLAIQLVGQLPAEAAEALLVLDAAVALVRMFLLSDGA